MDEARPLGDDAGGRDDDDDLSAYLGEVVSLPESLVVSPSRGRFRREALTEGSILAAGAVIGRVAYNGGSGSPVTSEAGGVFLGWLAWDGEILQRGTPLARIGPAGNGSGPASPNGHRA